MSLKAIRHSYALLPHCTRNVLRNSCVLRRSPLVICPRCTAIQRRAYSAEAAIAPVHVEGTEKQYTPKIQQLVDEIGSLTLIEVAELNELLKSTLNISDAPMMAMGSVPASAAQEEEDVPEVKQEKSLFTVKLVKFEDAKKVQLIKTVKGLVAGMNLVQSKKFVETLPQTVQAECTKDEAEKLKATLAEAGGVVEID